MNLRRRRKPAPTASWRRLPHRPDLIFGLGRPPPLSRKLVDSRCDGAASTWLGFLTSPATLGEFWSGKLGSLDAKYDEEAAFAYLEARLWPSGPVCPRCGGSDRIRKLRGKSTTLVFRDVPSIWVLPRSSMVTLTVLMSLSPVPQRDSNLVLDSIASPRHVYAGLGRAG
jgi:hypothetical protein